MQSIKQKLLFGLLLVALMYWSLMGPNPTEFIDRTQEIVQGLGWMAPFAYTLGYILISLSGFSVTVMSLGALATFTPFVAFWVMIIGATIGATIAFVIADHLSTKPDTKSAKTIKDESILTIINRIEREAARHPFRLVLGLRLLRLPYIALSYAAGVAKNIPIKDFTSATLLSNIITAFFYVTAGAALTNLSSVAVAIVIAVLTISWVIRRLHTAYMKRRATTTDEPIKQQSHIEKT